MISKNTKPIYNLLFTKEIFVKILNVKTEIKFWKKCKSKLGKLKKNRVINTKDRKVSSCSYLYVQALFLIVCQG